MSGLEDESHALRHVSTFFEKYDRYECQELLASTAAHYMLSTDDFKIPTEPPDGLISQIKGIDGFTYYLMVPVEDDLPELDLREVHQIVRELTFGIYGCNQLPSIALEANYDQSTSCQLPPAYQDTRVGQILIDVDYMMKSLWHGAHFPREKRIKFSERWRQNFDVNANGKPETKKPIVIEFTAAGMVDLASDPDYETAYDKLPVEEVGDQEMAEEKRFFMSHVDDLSMQMLLFQKEVSQHKNLFSFESDWLISSVAHALEDKIDNIGYERLNARLQLHEIMLQEYLPKKEDVRRELYLLKLTSFLVPFLVGMKKRMKIPDINKMLPNMTGDEIKTERELPPLILSSDFKCKNFNFGSHYFHLHGGILIDYETPDPKNVSKEIIDDYDNIQYETCLQLGKWLDPNAPLHETYPITPVEYGGKRYYAFALEFETYYPQTPQKPKWVHMFCEEISKLRPKRLPLPDTHIHEIFKKFFGLKKAIKYKNLHNGLKAAASRGLVSVFSTLCRKCPPQRLGKQDEVGLSLVHYAALYNRPQIIAILILQSMDINVRRNNNLLSAATGTEADKYEFIPSSKRTGPTPLHLAARCGAMDAVACLVANYANILAVDQDGWAPIHYAAYYDHKAVIKVMIRKNENMLELQTKNDIGQTSLLLAASSGALCALRCLIDLGAYILRVDNDGNNVIHLAAMRFHTNVLEFFIQWDNPDIPVWTILVGMLNDEDLTKKDSAVKCLEVMSSSEPGYYTSILDAGGIVALVGLLQVDNEEIQSVAASVLCNISENESVRKALAKANAGPILITLLGSPVDEIQSRASIILSDLACVDDNQKLIAQQGGIPPLVHLLDSELEDVLVNAVNAIRVLCTDNTANQNAVAENGAIDSLVEFLTVNSDVLQAAAAAAIAALCTENSENQDAVVQEGAVQPIVSLVKGRNVTVQVKAAAALEALSTNNRQSQMAFLDLDAPKALIRLLKVWSMEVKEQGALALWSLSGKTKTQQKYIADRIGIPQLIDMLLIQSEKLQFVGCCGMMALGLEDMENQVRIANGGGIQPLVRLLRTPKTSERVLLAAVKVVATLCVGVAHRSNKTTQTKLAEEHAIPILVQLFMSPPTEMTQVEVAYSLGCLVLSHPENQEKLKEEASFQFHILLDLLTSEDELIQLKAGFALAIFAFNNTSRQFHIRENGGVQYKHFQDFLESDDDFCRVNAAFQIVVLARVIVDREQVSLTAEGVKLLVSTLKSGGDDIVIHSASLISSLSHTRAGITDALVTVGAIDILKDKLTSDYDQVRFACAVALGYLSYNRTAHRLLLVACRNTPGLYDRIMANIGRNPKISPDFTDEFRRAKIVGLPSMSLEINGGPPVIPHKRGLLSSRKTKSAPPAGVRTNPNAMPPRSLTRASRLTHKTLKRPKTTMGYPRRPNRPVTSVPRAVSAPILQSRIKSANTLRSNKKDLHVVLDDSSVHFEQSRNDGVFKTNLSAWDSKRK